MEDNECVFHNHRFEFDALVRDMRKAGLIARPYANVMAMTVCTCRRKASHRSPISEQLILESAYHVINTSHSLEALSPDALELVTSAAELAKQNPITSQGRLTVVISQALIGYVTFLKEERAAAAASKGEAASKKEKKTRSKPPADVIKLIIQKKKKKLPNKTAFTLPIFGGSSRQLFQNEVVGENFCKLCVKHRCVLELDSTATAKKMAANVPVTCVTAWCSSDAALDDVKKFLTRLARDIQAQSNQRWNQHRIVRATRRQMRGGIGNEHLHPTRNRSEVDPEDYKDVLSRDFEIQVHKQTRHAKTKCKTPVQRDDGSTYVEGHCLYCLMPFGDFKSGGDDVRQCRHHPGYVTKKQWTCCQQKCPAGHPSFEEHAQSGCTVSRHSWRPHKKAARDAGGKSYRYDRQLKQHLGRLTLA